MSKGGLYKNVKMSIKTADRLILVSIAVLVALLVFSVWNAGFIVTFDSRGGTFIEPQKYMYGDELFIENLPKREGYDFTGWYLDDGCMEKWDFEGKRITESITLYAGWEKED